MQVSNVQIPTAPTPLSRGEFKAPKPKQFPQPVRKYFRKAAPIPSVEESARQVARKLRAQRRSAPPGGVKLVQNQKVTPGTLIKVTA